VIDRGANVTAQQFTEAKAALKTFVEALRLSPDQAGVVSFTNTALVDQTLTVNGVATKTAIDNIVAGGSSYIGAGIAAAQAELTSARHVATATPTMIVLSDGSDLAAPSGSATLAAATAAKNAGIKVITLHYGGSGGAAATLMRNIATSNADYYVVGQ
jgi:Mg-chelatase subunit ChlD